MSFDSYVLEAVELALNNELPEYALGRIALEQAVRFAKCDEGAEDGLL
jgi:hypothetical protein